MSTLLKRINASYATFSNANKKIASYILNNHEEVLTLSAVEIGKNSGTSSASVVRFSKYLNCQSLEDLKIQLARGVSNEEKSIDTIITEDASVTEMVEKLSKIITDAIKPENFNMCKLENAIIAMREASTIYLSGLGASALVAHDLQHKLMRINKNVIYNLDTHANMEAAYFIKPTDVMLAFSYSGTTKEVLTAVKRAKTNKAIVIAITRNKISPLSKLANIVVNIPNNEDTLRIGAVASKFTSFLVADALFLGCIQKDLKNVRKLIKGTANMVRGFKVE